MRILVPTFFSRPLKKNKGASRGDEGASTARKKTLEWTRHMIIQTWKNTIYNFLNKEKYHLGFIIFLQINSNFPHHNQSFSNFLKKDELRISNLMIYNKLEIGFRSTKIREITAIRDWFSEYRVAAAVLIRPVAPVTRGAEVDAMNEFGYVDYSLKRRFNCIP